MNGIATFFMVFGMVAFIVLAVVLLLSADISWRYLAIGMVVDGGRLSFFLPGMMITTPVPFRLKPTRVGPGWLFSPRLLVIGVTLRKDGVVVICPLPTLLYKKMPASQDQNQPEPLGA